MPDSLLSAFALVFVIEGFLPLVAPRIWRDAFQKMLSLTDGQLRFTGLASMLIGLVTLSLLSHA